jgi:hypothetical protein
MSLQGSIQVLIQLNKKRQMSIHIWKKENLIIMRWAPPKLRVKRRNSLQMKFHKILRGQHKLKIKSKGTINNYKTFKQKFNYLRLTTQKIKRLIIILIWSMIQNELKKTIIIFKFKRNQIEQMTTK